MACVHALRRRRISHLWVRWPGVIVPDDLPLVFVSNHLSWWDAFLIERLHERLRSGSPLYTLLLGKSFRASPWLRGIGTVPLDPGKPATYLRALRSLASARALRGAGMSVIFFPQGRIWPSHKRPLGFQEGVRPLLEALAPVVVIPVAQHWEPLTEPSPQVFVRVGDPVRIAGSKTMDVAALEAAVTKELDRLLEERSRLGEQIAPDWVEIR